MLIREVVLRPGFDQLALTLEINVPWAVDEHFNVEAATGSRFPRMKSITSGGSVSAQGSVNKSTAPAAMMIDINTSCFVVLELDLDGVLPAPGSANSASGSIVGRSNGGVGTSTLVATGEVTGVAGLAETELDSDSSYAQGSKGGRSAGTADPELTAGLAEPGGFGLANFLADDASSESPLG